MISNVRRGRDGTDESLRARKSEAPKRHWRSLRASAVRFNSSTRRLVDGMSGYPQHSIVYALDSTISFFFPRYLC